MPKSTFHILIPPLDPIWFKMFGIGDLAPIIFTGPNISLILSDNKLKESDERKTRLSKDVDAGVDLFKHVRLIANNGIGMNKVKELVGKEHNDKSVEVKDQCWTLSAAIMF